MAKFNIKGTRNSGKEDDGSIQENGANDSSARKVIGNPYSSREASTSYLCTTDTEDKGEIPLNNVYGHKTRKDFEERSFAAYSRECTECFRLPRTGDPLPRLGYKVDATELEPQVSNLKALDIEEETQRQEDNKQFTSSGESLGSHGSSSSKGENELNSIVDCEIQWEDLDFGDEIGQGKLELLIFILTCVRVCVLGRIIPRESLSEALILQVWYTA